MNYFVPIFCVLTAIPIFYAAIHWLWIPAFFMAATALFSVAAGGELRSALGQHGSPLNRMVRIITGVVILLVSFWLGSRCVIDLHFVRFTGILWAAIGAFLGFVADRGFIQKRPPIK